MRLFYSPGTCSLSPHIVLREAGRSFGLERVDPRTHRTEGGADYDEINPKGYVPALELDGPGSELLTEGVAIVQYIADLVPDAHLAPPSGTFARYHLQEWLGFVATELHAPLAWLFEPDTPAFTQQRVRANVGERLHYLDGVLDDRGYLMGETFTVADAYLYAVLRWCPRFDVELALWPNLDDYFARVDARPAVQAALVAEGLVSMHRARHTA